MCLQWVCVTLSFSKKSSLRPNVEAQHSHGKTWGVQDMGKNSRWIECGSGMTMLCDAIVLWCISERVRPNHPSDIFKPRDGGTIKMGGFFVWTPSFERQGFVEKSWPLKTEAKTNIAFAFAIMWSPLHSLDFVLCVWKVFHSTQSSKIFCPAESSPQIVPTCIDTWQEMVAGQGKQLMLQAWREDRWFSLECLRTWHGAALLTWDSTTSNHG